jgi:hypothetical protein
MADAFDPYRKWLGIDATRRPIDHYCLLGVKTYESDPAVIQEAADERMLLIRKYQTGPHATETQQILNELSAAKLCLLDAAAKTAYDQMLHGLAASEEQTLHRTSLPADSNARQTSEFAVEAARPSIGALHRHPAHRPYYLRPWFPFAALTAMGLVAGCVWFVGSELRRSSRPPSSTHLPADPQQPTDLMPSSEESRISVQQEALGDVNLAPSLASLTGGNLALESRGLDEVLTGWTDRDDVACWQFHVRKLPPQGGFRVKVTYLASSPATYQLGIDGEERQSQLRAGEGYRTDEHFRLVPRTGNHQLTLRANPNAAFEIKWIVLSFPKR